MPLKTFVKVSAITNLSEARYCAGMGVDMLGFNVVENTDNFVNLKNYQDIRGWLSGPKFIAEIYEFKPNILAGIVENYAPDFLELAACDLEFLPTELTIPLILSVNQRAFEKYKKHIDQWKSSIAYVILNEFQENSAFSNQIAKEFQILLPLNKQHANIQLTLEGANAKGIVLKGGSEIKPGLQDYDHLAYVLEQLEVE